MNIAIIGMGLIGGSIAKAIKKYTDHKVLCYDNNSDVTNKALSGGFADGIVSTDGLKECHIVILALYPEDTVSFIKSNVEQFSKGAVILDSCGTKRNVCNALENTVKGYNFTFIGAHPMAGREFSGFDYAQEDLFQGASVIFTPYKDCPAQALATAENLYKTIGFSSTVISDPDTHDRIIAYTSQLAHVVSSAYVKSPTSRDFSGYSAGSFQDLTRVARLNENMWAQLFLQNGDKLVMEIDEIIKHLNEYKNAIASNDAVTLKKLLKQGTDIKIQIEEK